MLNIRTKDKPNFNKLNERNDNTHSSIYKKHFIRVGVISNVKFYLFAKSILPTKDKSWTQSSYKSNKFEVNFVKTTKYNTSYNSTNRSKQSQWILFIEVKVSWQYYCKDRWTTLILKFRFFKDFFEIISI